MFNILIAAGLLGAVATSSGALKTSEVTFKGADGLMLTGTLELPAQSNGKVPAMLLIPGSGPTDRDGNSPLLPNLKVDVLKEIADRLAAEGIATYRFDKRALQEYRSKWPASLDALATFFDYDKFSGDAENAFKMLQARPEVDPKRVGVLGHSEGATYTLQIAADLNPKAIVVIGCLGRKMGENLHDQIALRLSQQAPSLEKVYVDYTDAACAAMAAGKPLPPNMPQGLGSLFNPSTVKLLGAFCRIDPLDLIQKYSGPALAINGANDQQVSPTKDFPRILSGLQARPRAISEGMLVPNASHCIKATSSPTDDAFAGPIVPAALAKIASFAKANL
jgi:dienelactone hydrolase